MRNVEGRNHKVGFDHDIHFDVDNCCFVYLYNYPTVVRMLLNCRKDNWKIVVGILRIKMKISFCHSNNNTPCRVDWCIVESGPTLVMFLKQTNIIRLL